MDIMGEDTCWSPLGVKGFKVFWVVCTTELEGTLYMYPSRLFNWNILKASTSKLHSL